MNDVMFAELLESVREGMAILRGEAEPSRVTTITLEQVLAHKPVKPRRMVTTIRLPDFVHHVLALQARRAGISLNALMVRILTEYGESVLAAAGRELLERIVVDENIMAGQPVIRGTRLTVTHILNLIAHGATVDEILEEYDGLTVDDVQACLLFAQLPEQSAFSRSLPVDALEDIVLKRAVDAGAETGMVERVEVFRLLASEGE